MRLRLPLGNAYYDLFVPREMAFLVYPLNTFRHSLVKGFLNFSKESDLNPQKILEIGCGNGFFSRILSYKFQKSRILSIDTSTRSIQHAQKRNLNNVVFRKTDFFDVNESFDLIVSLHVFILLDTEKSFKKLHTMLKDGGIAFLTYTRKTIFTALHKRFYRFFVGDEIEFKNEKYLLKTAKKYNLKGSIIPLNYHEGSFALVLRK